MKYLLILLVAVFVSCSSPTSPTTTFVPEMSIEPNLTMDSNGYYRMNVERSVRQTLHRISLNTNYEKSTRIEWFGNSSWIYNHMGFEFEIPVINGVSYTSIDDGTAQTIFAPVVELVGDTITIVAASESIVDSVKVVLD